MTLNSTHRYTNTAVLSIERVEAPVVVTSAELDERLADVYARTRMRGGMLAGCRRHPRTPPVGRGPVLHRGRHRRRAGRPQRQWGGLRRGRPDDQHLAEPRVARAVDGGLHPRRPRDAALVPELRRDERVPGLRQRHRDRRGDDRRGRGRLRPRRRRRGLDAGAGGHHRPALRGERLLARRDLRVRGAHPRLRCRRDGARSSRPPPRGSPGRRRREPRRHRAQQALRRRQRR